MRSLGESREQMQECGGKWIVCLQQPDDLGAGLAASEGYDVATNRLVQKCTLVLISLQAEESSKIRPP